MRLKIKQTTKLVLAYAIGPFIIGFSYRKLYSDIFSLIFISGGSIGSMLLLLTITSFSSIFLLPLIGYLSDRTKTKYGRRKPYIFGSLMLLTIISLLTSISPLNLGILDLQINSIFFSILFIAINVFSTLYFLNVNSLFPEMFQNLSDRTTAYGLFLVTGNLGSLISYLFEPFNDLIGLVLSGIILILLIIVGGVILLRNGIYEPYSTSFTKRPILDSSNTQMSFLKKYKSILLWIGLSIFLSYSSLLVELNISYFGIFVLNLELNQPFLIYIPEISAIIFIIYWRWLALKIGIKKALKRALLLLITFIIPFFLIFDVISSVVFLFLVGACLSAIIYFSTLFLAIIIDKHELNTGKRREATFFSLVNIISIIPFFLQSLTSVFTFGSIFADPALGIRISMTVFPIIALGLSLLILKRLPYDIEAYDQIEQEISDLHKISI